MQVAHAIYQSELVSLPVFLLQNDFYVPVNHPDSDPASYTEFIESIHVVSARNKISSMASLDTRETQEQIINRSIEYLFNRSSNHGHMLKLGYRIISDDESARCQQMDGIENCYPNGVVKMLKSPNWCELHSRIGDAAMQLLLTNATLFQHVGNGCLVQLTGAPIPSILKPNLWVDITKIDAKSCPPTINLTNLSFKLKKSAGYQSTIQLNNQQSSEIGKNITLEKMNVEEDSTVTKSFDGDLANASMELMEGPSAADITSSFDFRDCRRYKCPEVTKNRNQHINDILCCKIRRHSIFYSRKHMDWPKYGRHDLISGELLSERLFEKIFQTRSFQSSHARAKWRTKQIISGLDIIIKKHIKCPYLTLLDSICPPSSDHCSVASFIKYHDVFRFVRASIKKVFPLSTWGSKKNLNHVLKYVELFIKQRRFETISLSLMVQGYSTKSSFWFRDRKSASRKLSRAEHEKLTFLNYQFLFWFFDVYICGILKNNFYITESNPHKQKIFYYRHDVWNNICKPAVSSLCEDTYREIAHQELYRLADDPSNSYSKVRLVPKESGLRPIMNLKRRYPLSREVSGIKNRNNSARSNNSLQTAFRILSHEKDVQNKTMGASVLGKNDVYCRLKQFKQKNQAKIGKCPIYAAKVDVKSSFDTIVQDLLLEVVEEGLTNEDYVLRKYAKVSALNGRINSQILQKAGDSDLLFDFEKMAKSVASKLSNAILVDLVHTSSEEKDNILHQISEHIKKNFVKIGNKILKQTKGIPQGSVLSPLLCSIFYSHLEQKKLCFLHEDDSCVLLRFVDDFLFLGFDRKKAESFLRSMYDGHPEYGCFINQSKTSTNFEFTYKGTNVANVYTEQPCLFPWCGYLINCETLDIQSDVSRYYGSFLSDSLTIDFGKNPVKKLYHKLAFYLKPKCHAIFLDTEFNSRDTVLLNIFENAIICAMKFHLYVKQLHISSDFRGNNLLADIVNHFIESSCSLIRSRASTAHAKSMACKFSITDTEIRYLSITAFKYILQKKPAKYFYLLRGMNESLTNFDFGCFNRSKRASVVRQAKKLTDLARKKEIFRRIYF